MAATVSPWAKPGAWALDAEQHEEEELLQQQQQQNSAIHAEPLADFPSLSAAAASAPAKSKKKKGQTLSLAEFSTYKPGQAQQKQSQQQQPRGLTNEELLALPTGPRQRTEEEIERDRTRLGGGFRSYGLSNGDSSSRLGSSRVSDEGRRNRESNREPLAPSRADETDDWGAAKKTSIGSNGFDRRERGERGGERGERGGFFNSQSRADDSDNWGSSKAAFAPTEGRRFSSERKVVGFASNGGADSSENWGRNKKEESVAAGGDRPRLNLQPRTLPVVNIEKQEGEETESKVFVPVAAAPRSVNPFGAARPREDVLAEKGQDWKKIDEQLEAVKIKETAPEKLERRRSFGLGNGRAEDRTERTWRKPDSPVESRPQSAEKIENGLNVENGENVENGVGEEN